ncbi:hypothetical protein [Chitiniphilus shinanonensis]|uniref:hypothetical protein n=1 Tax=Chitiniphilus shinanonensis TaxID=553088 RepID=UPI003070C3A0
MNEEELKDYLWKLRCKALYKAELSALYHQKRERFFEMSDKLTKAISLFGASAALAKLTSPIALAWFAGAIAVASALSLVFGLADRSRRHAELARNFRQLMVEIIEKGELDFSEADVKTWCARATQLEVTEPASLGALVVICQNELAAVRENGKVYAVKRWQRMLAHFLDFDMSQAKEQPQRQG